MLEAPLCHWFPVLYSGHVLQIVLYSLPACMGGDCAGCWQHVPATRTKTEKTFKVSRLGCRVWDWNSTAEKAGKEKENRQKEKGRCTEKALWTRDCLSVWLIRCLEQMILSPWLQFQGCYSKTEKDNTDWKRKNQKLSTLQACCCCHCSYSDEHVNMWSSSWMSAWDGHWVTWVTDAGVAVPVITAVAVLRTRIGITGVIHFTTLLHIDLDSLFHVECSYICRCLSHSYSLVTKDNYFQIRVFIHKTVLCVSLLPLIHEVMF